MRLSQLEKDLIRFEGLKYKPYTCTAGKWTCWVGHNLKNNPLSLAGQLRLIKATSKKKRKKFAIWLLRLDIWNCKQDLYCRTYNSFQYSDLIRYEVLIQMVFQLGMDGFTSFKKMHIALKSCNWYEASREMLNSKWAREDSPGRAKILAERMRTGRIEKC